MNINVFAAIPEIFLAGMIVFILLVDAFISENRKCVNTLLTVIALIGAYVLQLMVYTPGKIQLAFNNMFILDNLAQGMKLLTYVLIIVAVLYV